MSSNEDKDKAAKDAARAGRSNKPSTPGATAVAAEEVARLDERIAEKRGEGEGTPSLQGTNRLEGFQADILAKQGKAVAPADKPGAFSGGQGSGLNQLEQDIAAKTAGATTPASDSLSDEVAAKRQGRPTAPATIPGAVSQGSRRGLDSLEADISAKQQGQAVGGPAATPGAVASRGAGLSNLESDVMAKQGRTPPASSPGAVATSSQLSSLEHDVAMKQGGGISRGDAAGGAQLTQLEQDIAVKQSRGVSAAAPGAMIASSQLTSLEDAVVRKNQAAGPVAGQSGLSSLEDAVARKTHGGASGLGNLDSLEASLDQKIIGVGPAGASNNLGQTEAVIMAKNGGIYQEDMPTSKPFGEDMKGAEPEQAPKLGHSPDVEYGVYDPENDGLAVALPVTEDEEDPYIQSAVEYDPDAKPPIYRRRRFRLYALLGFFALMAAAVGAVIGVVLSQNNSGSDEVVEEPDVVRERVERLVGEEELNDPDSPYYKAYYWMKYNDTLALTPTNETFVQRFVLTSFYYATSEMAPWRSCNPSVSEFDDETCNYQKLVNIAPESFQPIPWIRWLSATEECEWAGIACDDSGQVRTIELNGSGLNGKIPGILKYLPFLQSISMALGSLSGSLPADLVELQQLVNIELQYNDLEGPIPETWWAARHLTRLNLGNNDLTGTIPDVVGENSDMRSLFLDSNDLEGTIPPSIGNMKSLAFLFLNRNRFTGPIPDSFTNLVSMENLRLQKNDLNGTIPAAIGNLKALTDFRIQGQLNRGLGGNIPASLWDCKEMIVMDFRDNSFTGALDPRAGNLEKLIFLRLSGNAMEGPIPSSIGNMKQLNRLNLEGPNMDIKGAMPPEVCALRSDTGLSLLAANCLATDGGDAEVQCAPGCCTLCCEGNTTECEGV